MLQYFMYINMSTSSIVFVGSCMLQKKGSGKGKAKGKGKGKKGSKGTADAAEQPVADPFSTAARLNAYYIAHGPAQFLGFRGYGWSGKGGGAKKKKKK